MIARAGCRSERDIITSEQTFTEFRRDARGVKGRPHGRLVLTRREARYNRLMRPTLEDGLRALREATELAKQIRIDLDDDYLRWIASVEALPQNQSGSGKIGRWLGSRRYWDFVSRGHIVSPRP
jgi:hypothetical protein